ncbi:hypothetical protein LT679_06600 [Mucilaginibacter roseus]|uniref:DUF4397 domain-containing protein n=1 Tax=Mucilaginibacter roseus TaxID=1528868 RepID=A0ABS8U341_9SPHI|nr:hypothetical protein [Mucilaginibacter roseus]MCD8740267.1 hypothetical protein [Mucilaginibacter roseus]
MKKNLILLTIISLAFFACKKDRATTSGTDTDGKKYAVTFGVNGFDQVTEPIGTKAGKKTLADTSNIRKIASLSYVLYNTNGKKIKTKNYKNTEVEFGSIRDSLPQGNYIAVIIGGDFFINGDVANAGITFYKKISFTVSNSPFSQSVTLERMNAGLQVIVEDTVPAGDYPRSYRISVNDYSTFSIFNYQPLSTTFIARSYLKETSQRDTIDIGTIPSILNTVTPMTVTVGAYRNSNGTSVIALKTIGNVMFYRNKKTILRGKLFNNDTTGTGNAGFKISFNNTELNIDSTKYGF